ncbi:MAG: FimB/Mfa2 family fimbrial subunit [Tannerella sp.]|jgi:hypothetical protein|nr:FimB/Mfa2 family fimbrial subunit [Tannerella sp.]
MKKKPIKKKIWNIAIAIAFLFAAQGCVKDNLGDCGLNIRIQYTKNKAGVDHLANGVNHLTLYVFDSNRTFVGAYPSQGALYNGYTIPLLLKSGTYDFVVWGNLDGDEYDIPSLVPGQSQASTLNLKFKKVTSDNRVVEFPDSLYYGAALRMNVRPSLQENQDCVIDLKKNTKKITVKASGLTGPESEGKEFNCNIVSRNAGLRFLDDGIFDNTLVTYVPRDSMNEQEQLRISEFVVLREIADNTTESKLIYTMTENGQVRTLPLPEESLVAILKAFFLNRGWNIDERWDIEDEFVIELAFNLNTHANATITINGWEYDAIGADV